MTLTRGSKRFFEMLLEHNVDDVITEQQILAATHWKESAFLTYLKKNKLSRFLHKLPNGSFRVVRAGPALREQEVKRALTQVSPSILVLTKGDMLEGSSGVIYRLIREIGRGAVGHVWAAKRLSDSSPVAVKVVNPRPDLLEPVRLKNVTRRFRREARNGVKLDNPHVVRHIDHGELSAVPFLVMERASRSWGDVLDTEGPVEAGRVAGIIIDACKGLIYLHSTSCVHRDVKPDNLLVTPRGTVVGDLGIVGWPDLNPEFISSGTITTASVQLGSWQYMAPEQLAAPHEATSASDVYALGVSWHELLTRDVLTPSAFGARAVPKIPTWPEAHDWILRMTSYSAPDRPGLDELLQALQESVRD
jgi:serine/threonine protein kinase